MLKQAEETDGLSLPQIMSDPSVQSMREHRAELEAQYKDQLSFFKPGYPEMTKLKAQIDEIDRQIKADGRRRERIASRRVRGGEGAGRKPPAKSSTG